MILIVFFPVVNLGLLFILGSGMNNVKIIVPFSSLFNTISPTAASAVPDTFTNSDPFLTHPEWSVFFNNAKSAVSIFKMLLVLEYDDPKVDELYGSKL